MSEDVLAAPDPPVTTPVGQQQHEGKPGETPISVRIVRTNCQSSSSEGETMGDDGFDLCE